MGSLSLYQFRRFDANDYDFNGRLAYHQFDHSDRCDIDLLNFMSKMN
jgi:hypothetical protein